MIKNKINFIKVLLIIIGVTLYGCSESDKGFKKLGKTCILTNVHSEDEEKVIIQTTKFIITEYKLDTIIKPVRNNGTASTLEEYSLPESNNKNTRKVDLNDYLGFIDRSTDWNYTESDDYTDSILVANKIYYDNKREEWRQRY